MRITIHIRSGLYQGRRYALGPGQQLKFGCTDESDVSFPDDNQLSSTHFQLAVDQTTCRLKDLESTNGTIVNGEAVHACVVGNGDSIKAGGTTFHVQVDGDTVTGTGSAQASAPPPPAQSPPAPRPVQDKVPVRKKINIGEPLTLESCPSGLLRITGNCGQINPVQLAEALSNNIPLYIILDPHRASVPQDEIKNGELILNWLAPAASALVSPLLVPGTNASSYISAAWGADAVVCILSSTAQEELLETLRQVSRPKSEKEGVLGICWPQVLSHLLHAQSSLSERLSRCAIGYLVEDPTSPEQWQLYGGDTLPNLLAEIGIATEAPVVEETEATA